MNSQELSQLSIDPSRLKNLFKHLSIATKRIEEKELAKKRLKLQLEKVKYLSIKPTKRPLLEVEFRKLEERMKELLEIETKLLSKKTVDNKLVNSLTDKITKLQKATIFIAREKETQKGSNKRKIDALQHSLSDLKAKMETYIDIKTLRDRRMEEIENKIKQSVDTNKIELFVTQEQINAVEERLKAIQSKGEVDEESLAKIKRRIELLKEKARRPYY